MFRQRNTATTKQPVLRQVLLGLLFLAGCLFGLPASGHALSNVGPDPADLGGRAGERFGYTVATPSLGAGAPTIAIPVYYMDNAGTKTITITGGDLCSDPVDSAPLLGGNDRDISFNPAANPTGAIATQFYVRNERTATNLGAVFSHVNDADTCFSDQIVLQFDATAALTYDPRINLYYGYFYASMSGAIVDAANRFNILLESSGIVGYSARNTAQSFGVTKLYPYATENEFRLPFAPDCTVSAGQRVQAVLHDLDNGDPEAQNGLPMLVYVEEIQPEGGGVRIPVQFTQQADPASQPVAFTGDPNGYSVVAGNNETVYVQINIVPGRQYVLGVTNVYYKNGVQFQLPFDSIYSSISSCDSPNDLSCGTMTLNPKDPEVNEPLTVTATFRYNRQVAVDLTNPVLIIKDRSGWSGNFGVRVSQVGNTVTFTSGQPFVLQNPNLYTVQWAVTANGERVSCGGSFLSGDSFLVVSHPLLKVTGGDVAAGSSFSTGTGAGLVPCSSAQHNPKAGIVSWNRGGPNYVGAGTQYGAFAMSYIQSFVTNQGNSRPPTSLAFSNVNYRPEAINSVDPAMGFFGGLFGTGPCVDYWGSRPDPATLPTIPDNPFLAGYASDRYYYPGGQLTIGPSSIPDGRRLTIYVEGDVNITGDIVYASDGNSWQSTFQIPSFKLIVKGRIFVNSTVNRLDGLYVAVPDDDYVNAANNFINPIPGTLSTCSSGFTSYNPYAIAINNYLNECNRRLTVNGSLLANQILFLRTFGTLSTNEPAEVVNYNPEMWLAPPDHDTFDSSYRSVVGLPPVL